MHRTAFSRTRLRKKLLPADEPIHISAVVARRLGKYLPQLSYQCGGIGRFTRQDEGWLMSLH